MTMTQWENELSYRKASEVIRKVVPRNVIVGSTGGVVHDAKSCGLVEVLGYPPGAKLLIIHGDDMGLCQSVNRATTAALEQGCISSASVMVPCPWFGEAAEYARTNPQADIGVHLTFTSEWKSYRWGPVAAPSDVPSLLGPDGCFWPDVVLLASNAKAAELELEMRAQVERALNAGVAPTHVDCHMFAVFGRPDLYNSFVSVAKEYSLPFLNFGTSSSPPPKLTQGDVLLDDIIRATERVPPQRWNACHIQALSSLKPGIYQLIVHLGFDDSEMRSITAGRWGWGSEWRQLDYDLVTSSDFRDSLRQTNIRVIGWKTLSRLHTRVTGSPTSIGAHLQPHNHIE